MFGSSWLSWCTVLLHVLLWRLCYGLRQRAEMTFSSSALWEAIHDATDLLPLFHVCGATYSHDVEGLEKWECGYHCEHVSLHPEVTVLHGHTLNDTGALQAIVGQFQPGAQPPFVPADSCVVAVRGTQYKEHMVNAITNLRWSRTALPDDWHCPGCGAHTGFFISEEKLRPGIEKALLTRSCKNVLLTGHSMGAAVVSILAYKLQQDLATKGAKVVAVVGFGTPRAMNSMFAKAAERSLPYLRVVNDADPVPHLPPRTAWLPDFRHAGPSYFLNEGKQYVCDIDNRCLRLPAGTETCRCPGYFYYPWDFITREHCLYPDPFSGTICY
eukprot:TRINITY_DN104541_c0_g1_i1.p1 TRINITY_DN104541_c0_g1~~TRINITY_DN104541_c0_g1_i1.p1  ORF type:complete len:327 (-),score=20.33 TRINITY_DN104541_c0_g1_i1:204-1184(-)